MKLFIAVPTNRGWNGMFGHCIIQLVIKLQKANIDFTFDCLLGSSCLSRTRSEAIKMARQVNATHILFLDDDMGFPDWIAEKMIERNKPVVIANSSTKQMWNLRPTTLGLDGQFVFSRGKTGVERVKCGGLAIALISLEAIKDVKEPLFAVPFNGVDYVGEDFFFFSRLEEACVEVYVDHDVSQKIVHVGDFGYGVL